MDFLKLCSCVANKNVTFNNKHPLRMNEFVEKLIKLSKNQFPNILVQRLIQNPVEHLRWSILLKWSNAESFNKYPHLRCLTAF